MVFFHVISTNLVEIGFRKGKTKISVNNPKIPGL